MNHVFQISLTNYETNLSCALFRQGCGGYRCLNVLGNKKGNDCEVADQYMQCVYNTVDSQVCTVDQYMQCVYNKVDSRVWRPVHALCLQHSRITGMETSTSTVSTTQ
jgi:hypothetical protein